MQNAGIHQLYHSARQRLLKVNRDYFLLQLLQSFLFLLFYALSLLLGFAVLDVLFDLSPLLRISFWVLLAGIMLFFMIRYILPSLRCAFRPRESDLYEISRRIGKHDFRIQDSLVNFLQIYREQGISSYPAFRVLSLKQLYQRFRDTDFSRILSLHILKKPAYRLFLSSTVLALLLLIFPVSMGQAVLKVLNPGQEFHTSLPISLENLSGDVFILKNETASLRGRYEGVAPFKLWLVLESEHPGSDTLSVERMEIPSTSSHTFSYDLANVQTSFDYWFEASIEMNSFRNQPATSKKGRVTVKERPHIRELQVKLTYPSYTGLPAALLAPNNGEINALIGTTADMDVEASEQLSRAFLMFKDSSVIPLAVSENRARGRFTVEKDDQYRIIIADKDSIPNYQPVKYSIFALSDEKPFVEITRPGQDLDLGDELQVPLLINLRDDFGFGTLTLRGKHIHSGSSGDTTEFSLPLPYQTLDQNRGISEYQWDLTSFYLIPDDFLEYYAEVTDNDLVSGPKSARSKTYIIRLPSLLEILEKSEESFSDLLTETEDISRETEDLKNKLQEINREMKREKELTWERKQEIQDQLDIHHKSLEKMDQIQQELQELVNNLDSQNMLNQETLEKFFELQKMFQDLATPEILEAMRQMQEALEKADINQLKQAMEQFQLSVEDFERRIERTYELFKQVQLEKKMDELVKMAEKIAGEQQQINEELKKNDLSDVQRDQLAGKQENIEQNTDFFAEKLTKMQEEIADALPETSRDLQEVGEFMQEQQLSEQMAGLQQQIQQGKQAQARQQGQKLESQLQSLQNMMQQAQRNMLDTQKQEVLQAMQKIQQDMLRSSFMQEKLAGQSRQSDMASRQVTEIAREQAQLRENTSQIIKQLIDLSQKTFFISPQMSQIMSSLMGDMESALQSLENRNPRGAERAQSSAMAGFNQAILSMQQSMQQLAQSNSSSGFEEFMQQLQQMAGQQGQLNQETMGLLPQPGQGRLQPTPETLGRLAAQQEMIKQSLENLTDQMGERRDIPGRLNELGNEMEKVIEDLKKQQLDRKVIERQQRILSRLLDAQKSIREKDHSKKRQAEREDLIISKSPPELKQEMLQRESALRKEMLKALKEGYSSEYKEFIRSYYEILSRQPQSNP